MGGTAGMGGSAGMSMGGGGAGTAGSGGATKSAGCGKAPTLKSGSTTVMSGAMPRTYVLRIPDNYDNNRAYRLILSYHGANGSGTQIAQGNNGYFGLLALSDGSAIFIAPNGTGGLWSNTNGEDVTFTDDILTQVLADLCVDTTRIQLEGFSMGGAMVNTLACARPGKFRTAVIHSAGGQPRPSTCMPIAYFGSLGLQENGGQNTQTDLFAMANGCTVSTLPDPPAGGHLCSNYMGCMAGYPVRWCPYDGGHTASPSDSGGGGSWMPAEVWAFMTMF
jgi:predicted esterase